MHLSNALIFIIITLSGLCYSQNGMVGDGFGGRLWYKPTNYTVGSYSGYSLCSDVCGSSVNQLYGWGSNDYGQLGTLGPSNNVPVVIPNMTDVKLYSTGYIMGAIKNDETGWAWGYNISTTPIPIITDVRFLDACSRTISYIKNDGTVWSVGNNEYGNFGDGTMGNSSVTPVQMQNINTAVRVATSFAGTVILLNDGSLMATGDNTYGSLGIGNNNTLIPLPITGLPPIVDIKSNTIGTLALAENGDVYFLGTSNYATSATTDYTPVLLPFVSNIVAISGCDDGYHFLLLDANKNCYSYGDNLWKQSGVCDQESIGSPQIVATDVIDIMAGETFSYIVKSDGSLWGTGMSIGGSIWLNLTDETRCEFTQMNISEVPGACEIVGITPFIPCTNESLGTMIISNFGGQEPYQYSIGGAFQSSNVFNDLDTGNYIITVQDANGCQYSTTYYYNQKCTPFTSLSSNYAPLIDFPNVFTPNDDNTNDTFFFPHSGVVALECEVFNRWGELVAKWNDISDSWDGNSLNNKECNEGVYYYLVKYSFDGENWESYQGYITLIR